MNAMASPPSPDPGSWLSLADHVEALLGFVCGAVVACGAAIWRMATWTSSVNAGMERNREETAEWRKAMLQRLDDMQDAQKERHEANKREMDQVHLDVRADRQETSAMRQEQREAIAALSARIDSVFARRI